MGVNAEHRDGWYDVRAGADGNGTPLSGRQRRRTPLSPSELERFRNALLIKRRQLLRDIGGLAEQALGAGEGHTSDQFDDWAEVGSEEHERSLTLDLVGSERELLRKIDAALSRIEEGRYGICEATGRPIGRARLNVQPWARDCIDAARAREAAARRPRHGSASMS